MQSNLMLVQKTAHYYTLGTPSPAIKRLWIACHGYGQAANKMIYKFEEVLDEHTLIVAPEGLSRFYFQGFGGAVGASWMTRQDRQTEIDDFCRWLQQLYDFIVPQLAPDVRISIFGFSQGVTTALRWIHARQPAFHHLLMWAGSIPNDIDFLPLKTYFADKKLVWIYGENDEFLTPDTIAQQRAIADHHQFVYDLMTFNGKHEIDRPTLRHLNEMLKV